MITAVNQLEENTREPNNQIDRIRDWLPSAPRVAVGLIFIFFGYSKLDSDPRTEWFHIFEQIGIGQWFRVFTGVIQVLGRARGGRVAKTFKTADKIFPQQVKVPPGTTVNVPSSSAC